jgi:tetratricopeptide (TPR) repeat protein
VLKVSTGKHSVSRAKKRSSVPVRRSNPAVDLFEKALKSLNRKDFERARDLLDQLIETYPDEREVVERARAYRTICDRSLGRRASRPKTFEDLLKYGIYHHNRGEYQEALKFLNQALEIHPRNEHVLYCVAAAAARAGDTPTALKALRSAITASSTNRAQARSDSDFDGLRGHADFIALIH